MWTSVLKYESSICSWKVVLSLLRRICQRERRSSKVFFKIHSSAFDGPGLPCSRAQHRAITKRCIGPRRIETRNRNRFLFTWCDASLYKSYKMNSSAVHGRGNPSTAPKEAAYLFQTALSVLGQENPTARLLHARTLAVVAQSIFARLVLQIFPSLARPAERRSCQHFACIILRA